MGGIIVVVAILGVVYRKGLQGVVEEDAIGSYLGQRYHWWC